VAGVDPSVFTPPAADDYFARPLPPTSTSAVSPDDSDQLGTEVTRGTEVTHGGEVTKGTASPPRPPTVVFVGRLAADKGITDLAQIWPLVTAGLPEAQLLLAGALDPIDTPGHCLDVLCAQRGVTRLGYVDEVPSVLRQADVLCLPSWREGMPAVVLEAAACAVPAVVWDVTGSRDAVIDGETGYLIPLGNHVAMAERLVELLSRSELRGELGAAARTLVTVRFDRDRVESLFADYLESLLGGAVSQGAVSQGAELHDADSANAAPGQANLSSGAPDRAE
jgi:glycosyltransferase involved in cell wall biosynthesis